MNQTADAVEVWCRPGFDGGHPQLFQFEIFDTQSAVLLYNKSGRYPHLRVGNLDSGIKLYIQVSAFNQRGRSPLVPLEAYTIKIADKQTGEEKLFYISPSISQCTFMVNLFALLRFVSFLRHLFTTWLICCFIFGQVIMETRDWASILGIASGISASILIVCIAIGLIARFRRQNQHSNQDQHNPDKMDRINDTTMTVNANSVDELQHNNEDPDIIINSNSGKSYLPVRLNPILLRETSASLIIQQSVVLLE